MRRLTFVVLLIAFLRQIFTKQPYKSLLMFFLLPILMIGFPAISEIKIDQGVIEIQKQTDALRDDPNSSQKRASLQNQVENLGQRRFKNPNTLATIASAQFALGHDAGAETNLHQALAANPSLPQLPTVSTISTVRIRAFWLRKGCHWRLARQWLDRQLRTNETEPLAASRQWHPINGIGSNQP